MRGAQGRLRNGPDLTKRRWGESEEMPHLEKFQVRRGVK
jgi:hypothetical protein